MIIENSKTGLNGQTTSFYIVGQTPGLNDLSYGLNYTSSAGDNGDGGPTNSTVSTVINTAYQITSNLKVMLGAGMTTRTYFADIGLKNFDAAMTPVVGALGQTQPTSDSFDLQFNIQEMGFGLVFEELGPGTLKVAYGSTTTTINLFGDDVDAVSYTITDTDMIYDIPLDPDETVEMEILMLLQNKKSKEGELVDQNIQFIGLGLYAIF